LADSPEPDSAPAPFKIRTPRARATRERLVDAAGSLLEEGGPSAVTLRGVGALAGVSHNAPYKHFAHKQDLLEAVAARELRMTALTLEASGASGPAIERVRALALAQVRQAVQHPRLFQLTYGEWSTNAEELVDAAHAARSAFVSAVTEAQAERTLPDGDPERVVGLILSVAHGAAHLAIGGHLEPGGKGNATPEEIVELFFDHFRR